MDRLGEWRDTRVASEAVSKCDLETRVLRNKLVNLTLDWELTALTLDAQRYKSGSLLEKESLRDSANAYRKCIAELNEIVSNSPGLARKGR